MLDILYQDTDLIAIHKPSGLLVHRSALDAHETRFAVQMLRDQIGTRVYPAHRLDKGTSGILLFALNPSCATALGSLFENQQIEKRYLAIVRGHPLESGTIDHPLSRRFDPAERLTTREDTTPQPALTHYRRLATIELPHAVDRYPTSRYALIELNPITGRRHQLRRHLKHIAHPIIGDATFGKGRHNRFFQSQFNSNRLLLACTCLSFDHPYTKIRIALQTPPSSDFLQVMEKLGWPAERGKTDYPILNPAKFNAQ